MKKLKLFITEYQKKYKNKAELFYKKGLFSESKTSGYVLIMVLVMSTLLVSVTSEFIVEIHTSISYMKKFDSATQAGYLAKSGVKIATFILNASNSSMASTFTGKPTNRNVDSYESLWAMDFPEIPVEIGTVKMEIGDENSKINVNAFANKFTNMTQYYYMAQMFFINMGLLPDFADVIHDWVDPDEDRMPYGAESSYYESLTPPYSVKNNSMDSIDELMLLKGFTPEVYYGLATADKIKETGLVKNNKGGSGLTLDSLLKAADDSKDEKDAKDKKDGTRDIFEKTTETREIGKESSLRLDDYFRVHGNNTDFVHEHNKININTASFRVISALTEKMSDNIVTEIINRRMDAPIKSVDEIKDLFPNEDEFLTFKKYLTVKSYIFKITVTATVNDDSVKIISYYNRDQKKFLYWSEE